MTPRPLQLLVLATLAAACRRPVPDASADTTSTVAPSSSALGSAAPPASAEASTAAPTGAWAPGFAAFRGTLGKTQEIRLAIERRGTSLHALYGSKEPGEAGEQARTTKLRGEMRDASRFVLDEQVGADAKGAVIEGRFNGRGHVEGTWKSKEDDAGLPFSAERFAPLLGAGDTFDAAYEGKLGNATRLRAELHRAGGKLHGVYRYAFSRQDLTLEGTISEPAGSFTLRETNAHGLVTGRIDGIFLGRDLALARWFAPDGERSFQIHLKTAGRYAPVALEGGGRVVAEDILSMSPCPGQDNGVYPRVTGLAAKPTEEALNRALRDTVHEHLVSLKECEDAKQDHGVAPWTDLGYTVTTTGKGVFAVELSWFVNGGALGKHGRSCFVASTASGKLTDLRRLLTPEGKKKLGGLLSEATLKFYGATDLAQVPLAAAAVGVGAAALCPLQGTLVVQLEPRPPGHNWDHVEVEVVAKEARTLFEKSELVDALFE